jgi:glycosyltransferase involved in cell wall biosynthesis
LACATLPDAPPIVRTRHVSTTIRNRPTTRWLYLRATAHIVTTGEALRQQLARENGIPLEHTTSVPTGIDLARFSPGDAAAARRDLGLPERPTLGIVATLRSWKGHEYLLEVLAGDRAGWAGWNVLIVGDGPQRERLAARIAALGLNENVRLAGQQHEVAPWFRALDLFVLPSYGEEGVPQAIVQAMACALPVVSTSIGAIAEAVDAGVTGLVVPPRDAAALARALAQLRDDPELRRRFGAAAHARAVREFGITRMLDRMEAVFRSVVERGILARTP